MITHVQVVPLAAFADPDGNMHLIVQPLPLSIPPTHLLQSAELLHLCPVALHTWSSNSTRSETAVVLLGSTEMNRFFSMCIVCCVRFCLG